MQWLVLLEAERGNDVDSVGATSLRRMLAAFVDPTPGALHSDDRYALQIEVEAPDASAAVRAAIHQWEAALHDVGLPRWELVRVEALTRDEFEQEFLVYDGAADGGPSWAPAARDTGDERGAEELLLRRAFHDPLTDLASQSLFRSYLEHALARPKVADERCALLLLDVDRFGDVNERLGPRAADSVLVTIVHRVVGAAGPPNKFGRMGGDQFAVFLRVLSAEEACASARRIVEAVAAPIAVEGADVDVTVSVGVALEEDDDTGDALLRRATVAARTAQERGGSRYAVFSPDMDGADVRRLEAEREAMMAPDTGSYLALLERVSRAVAACATLEEAGSVVLQHVCDDAGFSVGRLYVRTDDGHGDPLPAGTWVIGAPERFGAWAERHPLRPGQGVAGQALASGTAVFVRDIRSDPGLGIPDDAVASGLRGALAVPVVVDGRPVAVLEFFAEQALGSRDALFQLLSTVATHLAAVVRRSRAEGAHARAEARLRILVEQSGVHVKILGPDGRIGEQYPPTWPDTAFPMSAVDFVHPDDLAVAIRGWADALASPGPHPPFECRVRGADGSWQWAEVTAHNMLDEPAVRGIVTYGVNVDDRKRPEEALRRCEARLREAQALGGLGTWHVDLATGHVEWSDELYRILGFEPGEVHATLEKILEIAHPDDRPRLREQRRLLWAGAGQSSTFRVIGPDGRVRWISGQASAVRDGSGRVVAVQGTFRDVTERRELEQTARQAEQRLREIEALAGVGSWRTDAVTGRTTWSRELYEILGLDPARVPPGPDTFQASVHPDDRRAAGVQALCQRGFAAVTDFECRIVRPTGDIHRIRVRSAATLDGSGAVTAYHGVVRETTAQPRDDQTVPA
ncbi:MAG: PAS domain-containing protein [Actinomycetota bacterium]|nr:PAS domain-containing protein [Actinomycetota bacterium]